MPDNKVLLIFPGDKENKPRCPFSILVLASYLKKKNIDVKILDTRIKSYTNFNFEDYCLIGISAKTGEQVSSALKICKHIKKNTNIPIVWGGPHATFFPEQTCKSKYADFVIRSEGEETLYELTKAIINKTEYDNIKGLTYKKDYKIISNVDRPFMDMNKLDLPAFDLVNLNDYQDKIGHIIIETSRGCPHRCSFCYIHLFHKYKWRVKSIDKVIKEIKTIIEQYNIQKFFICDDNFFVDKNRVIDFCKTVKNEKLNLEIVTSARANYLARYNDNELQIIKDAGIKFISIGAESGSERILNLIKKDITKEDILQSAINCTKYNIIPIYSFVIGTPHEKKKDLYETIDSYNKLKAISPLVEINGIYIFTPYPGTPIYEEAIKLGYKPEESLEGWAKWSFSNPTNLPWLKKKKKHKLEVISKIALFWFIKNRFNSYGKEFKRKKLGKTYINIIWDIGSFILDQDAKIRFEKKWFSFGYEWIIFGYISEKYFKSV